MRYLHAYLYSDRNFSTKVECDICNGHGGHDTRPRGGGDRMEPDDYYWNGCDYCDEQGYFFNPKVKLIRRYKWKLTNVPVAE